jgi:hypothetical protein
MKKAFLIFFIAMISSIVSFGQLQEVKGVETKLTTYYNGSSNWFGYSFYNMNSIPVSVEVELHEISEKNGDNVIDVKTFNLQPKEEYVLKFENRFESIYNYEYPFAVYTRKEEPYVYRGNTSADKCSYYVKYKAYKIL